LKLKDVLLAQRVHELLGQLTPLSGAIIRADAEDGVVHLRGTVPGLQQARLAESLVAGVSGVRQVVNELRVQGTPEKGPQPGTASGVFHSPLDMTWPLPEDDQEV